MNILRQPFSKQFSLSTQQIFNKKCYFSSNSNVGGRQQKEEVEREWFKPNQILKQYHDDLIAKELAHVVYLEGPSGAGKVQLLERLFKLGYETVSLPFLQFSLEPQNIMNKPEFKDLQLDWQKDLNNQIEQFIKKKKSLKNGLLFVHRSPISSMIYSKLIETDNNVDKVVEQIKSNYKPQSSSQFGESIVYCKTPDGLIEQRVEGRYHFYDNQMEIIKLLKTKETQQSSIQVYDKLSLDQEIIRATLDTTSIKQACPSLLAMFDIYFTLSPKFQSILNNKK